MAEQKLLQLTVARVDSQLFDGEAVSVVVPGTAGVMEILANHEALISPLSDGTLVIKTADGGREEHVIIGGTLEVSNNHATILL